MLQSIPTAALAAERRFARGRRTMSLEQLGALGELLGAIASVILLAYIAIQIRHSSKTLEHNTRATEAATRQAFAAQDQAYLCSSLDPSVLAVAVSKLENGEEVSPLERSQLIGRQHVNFRVFESAFSQYRKGVLDENEWKRYRGIIAFLMRDDEPTREMWIGLRDVFDPDFITEVESAVGAPSESELGGSHRIASGTSVDAAPN
jgi:hypothetical protein